MPTNPTLHTRKLGSIRFTPGGRETLELDKSGVLLRLFLRLKYTVTNSATAPVTPKFMALARLIQRIEIMAGGRDVVQSIPGYFLAARAQIERGFPAYGMGATVVTTAGVATTYDVILPVDFTLPLGARLDDCALDTYGLSQLSAIVTWGKTDASDLFATPNGAVISNVSLDVEGQYVANPMRNGSGVAVSGRSGRPYLVRHLDFQEINVPATNNAQAIVLDSRTGLVVTSFMVATLADEVGHDDMLNSFRIEAASYVYALRDTPFVRAENVRNLGMIAGAMPSGLLYIDPRLDGSVVNAIDTAQLEGDLKMVADLTKQGTTSTICIQREALRPLIR